MNTARGRMCWWIGIAAALPALAASGQVPTSRPAWLAAEATYDAPFFPHATYDAGVPTPAQILGFEIGARPALHAEIERCLKAWSASPRVKLVPFGATHERRTLYYAVITSAANQARLDAIRAAIGKLADPRLLADEAEGRRLAESTPAVAWLGYTIHGDELSGSDAALAALYHLVASTDAETTALLDQLVILIDPILNPDGRDRFIRMTDEVNGYTPNLDPDAVQHSGRWPRGRTNHYLFDLNRDWIYGVHPESRARQRVLTEWHPQLLVDAHEMGHESSFLIYPPREPFNPGLPESAHKWWQTFASETGKSFDEHGWSYYTREWADFWYPGYSDGWGAMTGAIAILYEQARTGGRTITLPTGRLLTFREAVHHQLASTMSNLRTLAANRVAILNDYAAAKRAALRGDESQPQTFLLPPSANSTRDRAFIEYLQNQGIEVSVARQAFTATGLTTPLREELEQREMPAGTWLVQRRQPSAALVGAALDFDPHMDKHFLDSERKELETKRESRLYDVSAWSPPLAWALDAYWSQTAVDVPSDLLRGPPATQAAAAAPSANAKAYGYAISSADDSWIRAAAYLAQAGVATRVCEKAFRADGKLFPPGSLLIRAHENHGDWVRHVFEAAKTSGAELVAATTARSSDDTPDLGGDHFVLLRKPRVALVGDGSTDTDTYGAVWRLLDCDAGMVVLLVNADLRGADLRRYNVIIVPSASGALRSRLDDLADWVRGGGTLIAIGGAASHLADEKLKLSAVRRRKDILKSLEEYSSDVSLARDAGKTDVNLEELWGAPVEHVPPGAAVEKPETKLTDEALEEWRSVFAPVGTIVRGELDSEHWLTFGCPPELPLFVQGATALLAKQPVQTPVRLASPARLRLSGLLWPEAAVRLADSAYATVERIGSGQLILFAQDPDFRGTWRGTRRLLLNAILLGPGLGTSQPDP